MLNFQYTNHLFSAFVDFSLQPSSLLHCTAIAALEVLVRDRPTSELPDELLFRPVLIGGAGKRHSIDALRLLPDLFLERYAGTEAGVAEVFPCDCMPAHRSLNFLDVRENDGRATPEWLKQEKERKCG